jgi:hypothetical protein
MRRLVLIADSPLWAAPDESLADLRSRVVRSEQDGVPVIAEIDQARRLCQAAGVPLARLGVDD